MLLILVLTSIKEKGNNRQYRKIIDSLGQK